ncbi:MAG: TlyA family RNA methyltransferase [Eubacteriales bacterium]
MKEKKQRLDVILFEQGLVPSRQKAQAVIMAGLVYCKEQKLSKAGTAISPEEIPFLEVRGNPLPYVSRGGLKLEKAIKLWDISLTGCVCGDIGASTGGFTDCMLQNGAKFVYAVDSGYNQLDWKLRSHPQVKSLERCNARYLSEKEIPEKLDFFTVDVSFISLKLILPPIVPLLKEEGVCLIKPQFEAGREQVGKKGVVRDPLVHETVIKNTLSVAETLGFHVKGLSFSPIRGPEGNIEYLAYLTKKSGTYPSVNVEEVVAQSHNQEDGHANLTQL